MRYRRRSLKNMAGVTKMKRRIKKDLGIYEVTKHLNAPGKRETTLETEARL